MILCGECYRVIQTKTKFILLVKNVSLVYVVCFVYHDNLIYHSFVYDDFRQENSLFGSHISIKHHSVLFKSDLPFNNKPSVR